MIPADKFKCNVCGTLCDLPAGGLDREAENCPQCKSTVRLRSMVALLSQELFGTLLTLPEFPVLKGVRCIGMSDAPGLADRLAEKFDYTNTFYHQAPQFDVTNPDPHDFGRYDFIISSEVMEHVPQPVERAFETLGRMLKPDGFLLMTTPYSLAPQTVEHFPELHQFNLAHVGGKIVLVNRRKDGTVEVFEDLNFHGGHGSTLELRLFSEDALRSVLTSAGFSQVHFGAENFAEYGVDHCGSLWSLPIAGLKGCFRPPATELAMQYRDARELADRKIRDLEAITAEYERHIAFHNLSQAELERDLDARIEYLHQVEADFEERSAWALSLDEERKRMLGEFERIAKSEAEAWVKVETLEKELQAARAQLAGLQARRWTRLGHKLGALK